MSPSEQPAKTTLLKTEEELLAHEELRAREGLRVAVQDLGDELLEAADVRRHVEQHPWLALGAGALAGFVLARPLTGAVSRVSVGGVRNVAALASRFATLGGLMTTMKEAQRVMQRRNRPDFY